jgi:hypothetical protein
MKARILDLLKQVFQPKPVPNYGSIEPKGYRTTYKGVRMTTEQLNEHYQSLFLRKN